MLVMFWVKVTKREKFVGEVRLEVRGRQAGGRSESGGYKQITSIEELPRELLWAM